MPDLRIMEVHDASLEDRGPVRAWDVKGTMPRGPNGWAPGDALLFDAETRQFHFLAEGRVFSDAANAIAAVRAWREQQLKDEAHG